MSTDGSGTDPELSAHLRRVGATDSQIEGLDDTELIGLAGDLVQSRDLDLTLAELAQRCGASQDRVRAIYQTLRLDPDALAGFGDEDVRLMSILFDDETGLVEQVADELMRVAGTSLRRVAEAAVAA